MSYPPLNPWPHMSYVWNWMDHNSAKAAPTQSILPFLILSLSLKRSKSKEELEREDKGSVHLNGLNVQWTVNGGKLFCLGGKRKLNG